MDVLAHDIMRYEMLSEQDEYKALASVLQGNESEDFEFELQEVQLQPLPELQAVDDQFESEDPGAQSIYVGRQYLEELLTSISFQEKESWTC